MPELPEVEVTRQGLLSNIPGRKIKKISYSGKRLRTPIPRKLLRTYLPGNSILTVDRRAKYLLFRISNGSVLVVHLGMSGKLSFIPANKARAKHDHLCLLFHDSMELRFNDSRRFGSIILWSPDEAVSREESFSSRIGVEPFWSDFTPAYLLQQSKSKRLVVKKFLMDSRIIAGIGNIYANEILFAASVNPQQPADTITSEEWKRIISSTKRILKNAIRAGGSTISDFLGSSGNPGYFQVQFNVYNRADNTCFRCNTPISKIIVGGRATYFCPMCQPPKKP